MRQIYGNIDAPLSADTIRALAQWLYSALWWAWSMIIYHREHGLTLYVCRTLKQLVRHSYLCPACRMHAFRTHTTILSPLQRQSSARFLSPAAGSSRLAGMANVHAGTSQQGSWRNLCVNQPHLPTPAVTPARYALDESLDKVDEPPLDTMPKLVREVSTTLAQRAQDQQG
jgi:hypothetical protein